MKPSVGRIVHYQARGSADGVYPQTPRAAVIVELPKEGDGGKLLGRVTLAVFNPTGIHWTGAEYDENREPGTWSWPPKE